MMRSTMIDAGYQPDGSSARQGGKHGAKTRLFGRGSALPAPAPGASACVLRLSRLGQWRIPWHCPAKPSTSVPNDLAAYWMPFTANRAFKKRAAACSSGAKDMHYVTAGRPQADRRLLRPVVHQCRPQPRRRSSPAIQRQAAEMDYSPPFHFGHPKAFELASRIAALAPGRPQPCVLLQLRLRGGRYRAEDGARLSPRAGRSLAHAADRPRARLSRRRLRRHLGRRHGQQPPRVRRACWPGVDHLPSTYNRDDAGLHQAASRSAGAHLADELERLVGAARRRRPSPP